ncbi:hypothetical protein VKT23_001291 [Stygiomarasmius scandens]|uniref:Mid2 domain-containing protein n=1 Tax=Marasmiellus scandens TaxID=2682957 RepID=A0ABR1KAI4_9AGAR
MFSPSLGSVGFSAQVEDRTGDSAELAFSVDSSGSANCAIDNDSGLSPVSSDSQPESSPEHTATPSTFTTPQQSPTSTLNSQKPSVSSDSTLSTPTSTSSSSEAVNLVPTSSNTEIVASLSAQNQSSASQTSSTSISVSSSTTTDTLVANPPSGTSSGNSGDSKHHQLIPILIGGILGGILFVLLCLWGIFYVRRRRRVQSRKAQPFYINGSGKDERDDPVSPEQLTASSTLATSAATSEKKTFESIHEYRPVSFSTPETETENSLITTTSNDDNLSRIVEYSSTALTYHRLPSDSGSVLSTSGTVVESSRSQQEFQKKQTSIAGTRNTTHSSISPTMIPHFPNSSDGDQWRESTISTVVERRSGSVAGTNQSPYYHMGREWRDLELQQAYEMLDPARLPPPPAYEPRRNSN